MTHDHILRRRHVPSGAGRPPIFDTKYKDAPLANGPVKTAMVKNGKLVKATGKGAALGHTLATDPNPVSVVVSTGTKKYCMSFGGTTKFRMDRSFTAKNVVAPGACPP